MSIFIEKNGKKIIPVSIYVKFSLFLLLIALSSILLRPIQNALSREMTRIRTELIQGLEDFTGMEVRYSSLRPSFLGLFEIKNLKLIKDDTPFFTVTGIKIHFSLIEFIFRKKTFIHTVQIDYPSFFLDTSKDKFLFDYLKSLMDDRDETEKVNIQQITEFLPRQANYQIRHLNINLTDKFNEYKIENMSLNLREDEGEILLYGRFLAELKIDNVSDKTIVVSADAGINGTYSSNLEEGNAQLSVFYLTGAQQDQIRRNVSFFRPPSSGKKNQRMLFSMNPFNMGVTYKERIVNFTKTEEITGSSVNLTYNMETGGVNAKIGLVDFKPGNLISISDIIDNSDSILQLQITGNASFESEEGSMKYSADMNAQDVIVINAHGNENEVIIRDFHITSPAQSGMPFFFYGSAGAKGSVAFYPLESHGSVFFNNFSFTKNDRVNALLDISSHDGEIFVHGEDVSIAQTVINDFALLLYPLDKNMGITVSGFFNNGGAMYLDAVFNGSPGEIEAALSIDSLTFFEIAELMRPFSDIFDFPAISRVSLKNSLLNADIFFSTDFNNIVYNAPNIDLKFANTKANFSLSGTDHQLTLTEGIFFQGGDDELHVSSNFNFANPMDLAFSVNANYHDLSWNIDGQILDRTTLIIRDPNGLHAYGNVNNTGAISGYIEGLDYPVSINANIVYLNFYAALRYDSADFWNINIERLAAREANSADRRDFLMISGAADQSGANFNDFLYRDAVGMLFGNAKFNWEKDFSYLDFTINITDGQEAGEYYYSKGIVQGESIYVNLSVSDMHVNRFFKHSRPMLLSGDAQATWDSINLFNARVTLRSFNMRLQDSQLSASVDMNFSNDELLINDLILNYAGVNAGLRELHLNRAEGFLKAEAGLKGIVLDKNISGVIGLNANFNPVDSWLTIRDAAYKFDGSLFAKNFEYGDIKDDNFNLVFAGNDGSFSLRAGRNDMIRIELDSDSNFFAGFSSPVPVRGTIAGTLKNWNLDAYTNDFFIDISALYAMFSTKDEFVINGGYITGKANITGPIWNPEFHGNARASSMRFRAPNYISEDIRTVPFDVLAQGYEMSFGPVATVCGSGGGIISGWFFFENWSPKVVGLDINIPRESPVPYKINITGFLANGLASGKLNMNVDGINSIIGLKGELFTNEAQLGLSMDDIMSNQNTDIFTETVYYTVVDLKVTTGSTVEFVWPATSPILRANPEMGSVIYVTSDTQSQQYSLISDIRIRSGELYYFDRNFYIRQGSMVFKENETQFDPRISARAEIRDRTDTGSVVISMIIDNQPLFRFEPRFEASPGLTQLEIYSILGQNFNNIQGEESAEMAQRFLLTSTTDLVTQLIASSDVWSQFLFFRQLERGVRNTLGLDMFSVRTRVLQNMVASGASELALSTSTDPPGPRNDYVGNFFDNTSVFLGKYIGQHMFAQAMFTLKKDETSDFLGGIRVEPDIGIELQSPFLTIRWDLYPYRPEDWKTWVSGNSITLSWSKSF